METRRVLVVGGSPEAAGPRLLRVLAQWCDWVVAADHGADALAAAGLSPDVLVGDQDSIAPATLKLLREVETVYMPPEKDDTDLRLALKEAERLLGADAVAAGACQVVLTSVSGGRLDHQLGVIGCVREFAHLRPRIDETGFSAVLLDAEHQSEWRASRGLEGSTISVLSLSDPSVVTERGLHWELDRARLPFLCDLGVSNVVESAEAFVRVDSGQALVVLPDEGGIHVS
jgi:thiamine pyrophosphokinase